jgi:hypothetical protein
MDAWLRTGAFFMGFATDYEDALAASHEAMEASREHGDAWAMTNSQGEIADIYRRIDDIPRAIREFRITTELFYSLGYLGMLPWLKLLARLEISHRDPERAATLAAIAQRAVEDLGGELPEELTQVGNPLEDSRGQLSEKAFASAVTKGRAMSFEEAVAFALEK